MQPWSYVLEQYVQTLNVEALDHIYLKLSANLILRNYVWGCGVALKRRLDAATCGLNQLSPCRSGCHIAVL